MSTYIAINLLGLGCIMDARHSRRPTRAAGCLDWETMMAKTAAKKTAGKKQVKRTTKARAKKKVASPKKKKTVAKRKAPAAGKKKTAKKPARKKATKPNLAKNIGAVQAKLEKRVEELTEQLDELRKFVRKELARDMHNTRKYADAEMAVQKDRFDRLIDKIKEENRDIQSRLSNYIAEHENLKGVMTRVADSAKSLEGRVRKLVSGEG